ncbi:MAG TPA: multicopper oxidase domain-containing protein [Ilumatobacter sp.]
MALDTAPPDSPSDVDVDDHPRSDDRSFLGWVAVVLALAALVLGFVALGNIGGDDGDSAGAEGSGEVTYLDIELGALKLEPAHLMAAPGHVILRVENVDSQVHNLSIDGNVTPDLQPNATTELDLGVLAAGNYEMFCQIPGHKDAGMQGTLMISTDTDMPVDGSASGAATDTGAAATDYFHGYNSAEEMQAAMDARALRFVEEQKGEFGGQLLDYTMTADGYKQFDVTAKIVDWEVEPGKVVQAWTYNGTVPAPEMHAEVGDKVRVVLHNELPVGTVIHWHGIRVPNSMDGVPPFTQPAVMPGESFTYEFEALEPAVGIYHSHNGANQVLDGLFGAFTIGQMTTPPELLEQDFATTPDQTINMVLNDAGAIGLSLNGKSFPATQPYTGRVGETVMVNYYNEGLLAHPMHLHQPMGWIIAKDGKELLMPIPGDTINIAPGERYTVLYKLTDPGVWAWHCHILTHAEREDGMFGMVTAFIVEE